MTTQSIVRTYEVLFPFCPVRQAINQLQKSVYCINDADVIIACMQVNFGVCFRLESHKLWKGIMEHENGGPRLDNAGSWDGNFKYQLCRMVRSRTKSRFGRDNQRERFYIEGSQILTNKGGDICLSLIASSEPHAGAVTASARSLSIWTAKR